VDRRTGEIILSGANGVMNRLLVFLGQDPIRWYAEPKYWKAIIILADVWKWAGYNTIIYMAAMTAFDPTLYEAATIDGCGQARTFFEVVVPLLQPTVITVLILNGIWVWNDYLLPLLILGSAGRVQTIPLAVTAFAGSFLKQWDLILTSALLAMIPIIVLYLFAQKYIIKGMVEGAIK